MPLLAELGAVSQLYSAIVLTTACMVTRWPCMLQCCSADLCAAVSPHRLQTLNLADCSGGWTLVQGPDSRQRRGGEGAISWEPPHHRHQPRSFEWSQCPVSCSTLCATQTSEFIASSLGTCSSTRSEAKPVLRRVESSTLPPLSCDQAAGSLGSAARPPGAGRRPQ